MLKPKQKLLAEIMASEPSLRNADCAAKAGIGESTLYKYKADAEFQEYLSLLCKERFQSMEALAIEKLKENVADNQQKAIEYVLNGLGYKPKEQKDINLDANITIDYGE